MPGNQRIPCRFDDYFTNLRGICAHRITPGSRPVWLISPTRTQDTGARHAGVHRVPSRGARRRPHRHVRPSRPMRGERHRSRFRRWSRPARVRGNVYGGPCREGSAIPGAAQVEPYLFEGCFAQDEVSSDPAEHAAGNPKLRDPRRRLLHARLPDRREAADPADRGDRLHRDGPARRRVGDRAGRPAAGRGRAPVAARRHRVVPDRIRSIAFAAEHARTSWC